MSIAWCEAKDERIKRFGYYCEVCNEEGNAGRPLIGHHTAHREYQKNHHLEVWQLCELRHIDCEEHMHKAYPPNGNTPERQKEIDKIVADLLAPE